MLAKLHGVSLACAEWTRVAFLDAAVQELHEERLALAKSPNLPLGRQISCHRYHV